MLFPANATCTIKIKCTGLLSGFLTHEREVRGSVGECCRLNKPSWFWTHYNIAIAYLLAYRWLFGVVVVRWP